MIVNSLLELLHPKVRHAVEQRKLLSARGEFLGSLRENLVASLSVLTYDGTIEDLERLEAEHAAIIGQLVAIDQQIHAAYELASLHQGVIDSYNRGVSVEFVPPPSPPPVRHHQIRPRKRKAKRQQKPAVEHAFPLDSRTVPGDKGAPPAVHKKRVTEWPAREYPVPIVEAEAAEHHGHWLYPEVNSQAMGMLRWAPWTRRRVCERSRRYEGFSRDR